MSEVHLFVGFCKKGKLRTKGEREREGFERANGGEMNLEEKSDFSEDEKFLAVSFRSGGILNTCGSPKTRNDD